jgi:hypothetical protein
MVDRLPRREVVMREQAPGAAATHHIEDRASRISRKGCTLGRPEALGMGRWGSIRAHSASERSVWYALLIMPGILPGHHFTIPFQTVSKRLRQWGAPSIANGHGMLDHPGSFQSLLV